MLSALSQLGSVKLYVTLHFGYVCHHDNKTEIKCIEMTVTLLTRAMKVEMVLQLSRVSRARSPD